MAIITPAQFRDHYPGITGTGEDTRLATLIAQADALCAGWCGWPRADDGSLTLEAATYTVYVDGPDSPANPRRLTLPLPYVASITSVHRSLDWAYDAADLVDSSDYTLDEAGYVWLTPLAGTHWYHAPRAHKVVCVAGWATAPDAIVAAVADATRHLMDRAKAGRTSTTSARGASVAHAEPSASLPSSTRQALSAAGAVCWRSRVA